MDIIYNTTKPFCGTSSDKNRLSCDIILQTRGYPNFAIR